MQKGKKATVAQIIHVLMQEASFQPQLQVQKMLKPFARIFKDVG